MKYQKPWLRWFWLFLKAGPRGQGSRDWAGKRGGGKERRLGWLLLLAWERIRGGGKGASGEDETGMGTPGTSRGNWELGCGGWAWKGAYPNPSLVLIINWWWKGLVPFSFQIPECMCWGSISSKHLLAPEQGRWARYYSGPLGPLGGDREVGHSKLWEYNNPLLGIPSKG